MIKTLYADDYFTSNNQTIAIEPRLPQTVYPEHTHDFNEIVIVTGGRGVHILNNKPYNLYPGMAYYIQAADHHLYENVDDLYLTNILYRTPLSFRYLNGIDELLPNRQNNNETHWHMDKKNNQFIEQLLHQFNDLNTLSEAQKESLFFQLLVSLQQGRYTDIGNGSNEERTHQLLRWLKVHSAELIDWQELAERFELPLRTLHRHIKNYTGLTPQRYLTKLRLSEAYHQICYTDNSITVIAYDCGFNDSAYFSTSFKNEYDLTPRQLRNCPITKKQ